MQLFKRISGSIRAAVGVLHERSGHKVLVYGKLHTIISVFDGIGPLCHRPAIGFIGDFKKPCAVKRYALLNAAPHFIGNLLLRVCGGCFAALRLFNGPFAALRLFGCPFAALRFCGGFRAASRFCCPRLFRPRRRFLLRRLTLPPENAVDQTNLIRRQSVNAVAVDNVAPVKLFKRRCGFRPRPFRFPASIFAAALLFNRLSGNFPPGPARACPFPPGLCRRLSGFCPGIVRIFSGPGTKGAFARISSGFRLALPGDVCSAGLGHVEYVGGLDAFKTAPCFPSVIVPRHALDIVNGVFSAIVHGKDGIYGAGPHAATRHLPGKILGKRFCPRFACNRPCLRCNGFSLWSNRFGLLYNWFILRCSISRACVAGQNIRVLGFDRRVCGCPDRCDLRLPRRQFFSARRAFQ